MRSQDLTNQRQASLSLIGRDNCLCTDEQSVNYRKMRLGRGAADQSLGCRDQDGNLVDWYVLSKLPKLNDTGAKFLNKLPTFLSHGSASATSTG